VLGAEGSHVVLSQVQVHLDLVNGRDDLGLTVQPPQVVGLEVGDADGPGPALAVELFQRPPGLHEVAAVPGRRRPVDQEQVDVLGAERLERLFEGLAGLVGLVRIVAQLAGDEDLTAVQARPGDGLAHLGLVAVHLGGVDVPVPGLERRAHRHHRVLRLDLEDAEAELRDGLTVGQRDVRNGSRGKNSPQQESRMRTCCTCPDQAGLHTGGGVGPAPDFSRPSASATSCRPGLRSEPVVAPG
jgi:hypothetical protein